MNKAFKRTLNIIALALCIFTMNIVALAQGTTMIAVSKESPAVGDKVTVSVTASESGTITVKYTASMLNFISCTGKDYTASGNFITFTGKAGDVVFSAGSAGTASVIVSSTTCSGSSTNITIGGGSSDAAAQTTVEEAPAAQAEETPAEAPAEEPAEEAPTAAAPTSGAVGTLNANGGFDINGVAYVVSERYSDSEMPAGFEKKTITIGSSTYSEPVSGNVTLLYLKPADNTSGSGVFYSYNAEEGTVSQFLMLTASNDVIMISDAGEALSSAFQNISLDVTGGSTSAYTLDGGEFYYLYGTNKAGTTGWFVFDSANNTVSRVDESLVNAIGTGSSDTETGSGVANDNSEVYLSKLDTYRKVIMGLIVLCVLLVFVIINSLVKSRDKDDDDFDGDVFAKAPKKSAKKLPRSIVFGNPLKRKENDEPEEEDYEDEEYEDSDEEYYEDGDYEEDYEEEFDEEPSISPAETISNYDARRNSSLNMMDLNDL